MSNKISIKNTSTSTVVIAAISNEFPRREIAPSRELHLSEEQYEELAYDAGFQALVDGGFLKISGLSEEVTSAALGVNEVEQAKLTVEEARKIYSDKDYTSFTKVIQNASPAAKQVLTETAVAMKVTDNGFVQLLKKYCNYDVIEAISFAHKATEE